MKYMTQKSTSDGQCNLKFEIREHIRDYFKTKCTIPFQSLHNNTYRDADVKY